ncbi:MAG: ankyrin repeat domain-containing protein [Woeseiaceae bacterium]|nr:ankyrin repeat domain-containing protein [Woeseiaceae bacterium]
MGVVKKVYNFVLGLAGFILNLVMAVIGLGIIGLVIYVFVANRWEDHQEEQWTEARAEIVESVAAEARARGLGDLEQLRREYLSTCNEIPLTIIEGNADEVCTAVAETLLARSQERNMTLFDQIELQARLCAHAAEEDGYDADEYCNTFAYYRPYAMQESVAMGLCGVDSAWVIHEEYEDNLTKRGPNVYLNGDLRVDCKAGEFDEWDYEGFFEGREDEYDYDNPKILENIDIALDTEDTDRVLALLDEHAFGEDELTDLSILNALIYWGNDALLREVLQRNGGKVNFMAGYYNQPLSEAIDSENSVAALLLLEAGADPTRPYDDYGRVPVSRAASRGMLDVVKVLVDKGADVDGVVGSELRGFGEPLLWAAWNGHEEVALWLLQNGAKVAPDEPSQYPNWEPDLLLDYAVNGGDVEVIKALVARGAKSSDMKRLFESAGAGGSPEVMQLLFAQGYELPEVKFHDGIYDEVVDVIEEEDGKGPIENGVAMFELLLDNGLDLSDVSESGWNYAYQAVRHYAPATVELGEDKARKAVVREYRLRFVRRVIDEVLATGLDIDQRYESRTMLMEAADGGQPELVTYLLELSADTTLTDDKGETALDIAIREGRRLTAFWDESVELKSRFGDTIELLGGDRDLLDEQADST